MKVEIKNFSLFGLDNKQSECEKIVKAVEEFGIVEIELEESSYATKTLAILSSVVYNDKNYVPYNSKEPYPKYCKYQIVLDCKRTNYDDTDDDYKLIVRVMLSNAYMESKIQ